MNSNIHFAAVAVCLAFAGVTSGQTTLAPTPASTTKPLSTSFGVVVFPAKGQSAQKQSQDEGECYAWSKGQTGVDPIAALAATPPPAPAAVPATPGGQRLRGAARGAAAGAIIGEVADDDAGKGAAIGATAGALRGGGERRRQQAQAEQDAAKKQEQAMQQHAAATQEQLTLFKNGFGACLESKGYTVK
jgi:hypothetical protein